MLYTGLFVLLTVYGAAAVEVDDNIFSALVDSLTLLEEKGKLIELIMLTIELIMLTIELIILTIELIMLNIELIM